MLIDLVMLKQIGVEYEAIDSGTGEEDFYDVSKVYPESFLRLNQLS